MENRQMKAIVIEKPGTAVLKEVPMPEVGDGEVLVRVQASGICGTDIHIFRGDYFGTYPVIPGHEFSGIVEQVGHGSNRIKVGDRVAIEPNIACDNCSSCLNNRQNFCENWNGVGVTLPGGMAEYAAVPEKAVYAIGDLPFTSGAFVEPLACVLHGVERARFSLGDKVLIIGAGPIGILLSRMIQLQGSCSITQVDKNQARLALAVKSGADRTESSLEHVEKDYFDAVVDATGVLSLMEQSISYARKGGTVLMFGVPPSTGTVNLPAFSIFHKGLTVLSSFTSVRNSIQAVRLLTSGKIDVSALVSHRLPLGEFERGVELIESGQEGVLKVLIDLQE